LHCGVFEDVHMCENDLKKLRRGIFNERAMEKLFNNRYEAQSFEDHQIKKINVLISIICTRFPKYMLSEFIAEIVSLSQTTDDMRVIVGKIICVSITKFGKTLETAI